MNPISKGPIIIDLQPRAIMLFGVWSMALRAEQGQISRVWLLLTLPLHTGIPPRGCRPVSREGTSESLGFWPLSSLRLYNQRPEQALRGIFGSAWGPAGPSPPGPSGPGGPGQVIWPIPRLPWPSQSCWHPDAPGGYPRRLLCLPASEH